jgi:hypothetical protein
MKKITLALVILNTSLCLTACTLKETAIAQRYIKGNPVTPIHSDKVRVKLGIA